MSVAYPFAEAIPGPGEAIAVAPGILWIRMPLPFALDHINLWLLDGPRGWTLVDTGFGIEATWTLWERHFAEALGGRPVTDIVVTHYHPDHLGSADWLVARTGAPLWMTTGEFLSGHAALQDTSGFDRETSIEFFRKNGVDTSRIPEKLRKGNGYARGVPAIPRQYRRMIDGDRLRFGHHEWEVITVFGHAPEHASLYCAALDVLISGDQVLPRITTNVGVWGGQPEANPLALFLDSLGKFAHIPAGTLVLPSHDRVFRGLHERIAELHAHHAERLEKLLEACREPVTAVDVLPVLFKRALDEHQMIFAMGEAIAHLHFLERQERVVRETDADGVRRFRKVGTYPIRSEGSDH